MEDCLGQTSTWKDQLQLAFRFIQVQNDCDYCGVGEYEAHTEDCQSPDALSEREAARDLEFDERAAMGCI